MNRIIFQRLLSMLLVTILVIGMGFYSYSSGEPMDLEETIHPEIPDDPIDLEIPGELTDPEEPIDSETPGEPTDQEEPMDPETPSDPTNPNEPTDPEELIDPENPQNSEESIEKHPCISVAVTAEKEEYMTGETINYTITISNTGDVDLEGLILEDSLLGGKEIKSLEIEDELIFTEEYIIPKDFEEEIIENNIKVSGIYGEMEILDEDSFLVTVKKMESKAIISVIAIPEKQIYSPGEIVNYQIIIKNEGDEDLENVSFIDSMDMVSKRGMKVDEIFNTMGLESAIEDEFVFTRVGTIVSGGEVNYDNSFELPLYPETKSIENRILIEAEYKGGKIYEETSFIITLEQEIFEDTIEVDKTAVRSNGCRDFDVELEITGTPPPNMPLDIVLVIDRSGSMTDNITTYSQITSEPNRNSTYYVKIDGKYQRINYYRGDVWRYTPWFTSYYVKWDLNGDDNEAGNRDSNNPTPKPFYTMEVNTRLFYAQRAAKSFVNNVLDGEGADINRISLVTYAGPRSWNEYGRLEDASLDVELTANKQSLYSAIDTIAAIGGTNIQAGFRVAKNHLDDEGRGGNVKRVVVLLSDGMASASIGNMTRSNDPTDRHTDHTEAAYTEGQNLWPTTSVYTVGIFDGIPQSSRIIAVETLNWAQNSGFYDVPDPGNLEEIYNEISQGLNYSARDAIVYDEIDSRFKLVENSFMVQRNNGTVTIVPPENISYDDEPQKTIHYDRNTQIITWNVGTIGTQAKLIYKIQARSEFEGGIDIPTNEYATLFYTDVNDENKTQYFPIPSVYVPKPLRVSLTDAYSTIGTPISLGIGTDSDGENYMSSITGGDGNGTYTYTWVAADDPDTIISTEKHPFVNPEEDTLYIFTVEDSNGCKAKASMWVKPRGTITITKMITDVQDKDIDREFSIWVYGSEGTYVVTPKHDDTVTIVRLKKGEYSIKEIMPMNFELEGMIITAGNGSFNNFTKEGKVSIGLDSPHPRIRVNNKRDNDGWFYDENKKTNTFELNTDFESSTFDIETDMGSLDFDINTKMDLIKDAILQNIKGVNKKHF